MNLGPEWGFYFYLRVRSCVDHSDCQGFSSLFSNRPLGSLLYESLTSLSILPYVNFTATPITGALLTKQYRWINAGLFSGVCGI